MKIHGHSGQPDHNKSPECTFRGFVIIGCACLLWLCGCGTTPVEVLQHFDNGDIARRHYEVKGKKEGLMTDYHPNGAVRGERWFVDDLQHGRTVWFYPDGTKRECQLFDHGVQTGPDSMWMENGALQRVILFENGKKHGPMRTWSESGELILEVLFHEDSLVTVVKSPVMQDTIIEE